MVGVLAQEQELVIVGYDAVHCQVEGPDTPFDSGFEDQIDVDAATPSWRDDSNSGCPASVYKGESSSFFRCSFYAAARCSLSVQKLGHGSKGLPYLHCIDSLICTPVLVSMCEMWVNIRRDKKQDLWLWWRQQCIGCQRAI